MDQLLINQIQEEFEMKIARLKIVEKKLIKDVDILKTYYQTKQKQSSSANILSAIKTRSTTLYDTQNALIELQQNKIYFQKLLNNN